jgi:hypothetical protein
MVSQSHPEPTIGKKTACQLNMVFVIGLTLLLLSFVVVGIS